MGVSKEYNGRIWSHRRVLVVFQQGLIVSNRFLARCWKGGTLFGCWWFLFLIRNKDILIEDKDYLSLMCLIRFRTVSLFSDLGRFIMFSGSSLHILVGSVVSHQV
jgi:hypothetical protein